MKCSSGAIFLPEPDWPRFLKIWTQWSMNRRCLLFTFPEKSPCGSFKHASLHPEIFSLKSGVLSQIFCVTNYICVNSVEKNLCTAILEERQSPLWLAPPLPGSLPLCVSESADPSNANWGPGRVAQSVRASLQCPKVVSSIPGQGTYKNQSINA